MKTRNSHGLLQLGREALAYCQCASALISGNKALLVSVDLIGEKNQVILEYTIIIKSENIGENFIFASQCARKFTKNMSLRIKSVYSKLTNRSSLFVTRSSKLNLKPRADWSTSLGTLCLHWPMCCIRKFIRSKRA